MDHPITDLSPAMTTHTADYVADPSPPTATNHAHPPYAEMITAAIVALKDKDGSSRQAISKYIEKEFINLPPTHPVLLTQNLKRLKNQGQLIMVKHSYMLPPGSAQFPPPTSSGYLPTLDFGASGSVTDANAAPVGVNVENPPSGMSKRKPGRPPKLKPVPGPGVQSYSADVSSYQPQFHYDGGVSQDLHANYGSDFQGNSAGGTEPLFASLGLGDDGVAVASPPQAENTTVVAKRGRGRPPKAASGGGGGQVVGAGGHVADSDGGGGEIEGAETGPDRPVRKAKMMSVMMGGNGVRVKRGRGRPKRIGIGAVTVPLSGNVLRPRGRPKRVARPNVAAVNGSLGQGVLGTRRRGRPARASLSGKPLGRPSKGGPGTAVIVTDPRQLVVYQELKTKYELLQSKVKEVASAVKPCIDPNYGSSALGALQELEDLAGEVNAPSSHGQTQEPAL